MSQLVPVASVLNFLFMAKVNKIFLIDRDRALEIMWKLDAEYDSIWNWFPEWPLKHSFIKKDFNYPRFKKWLTYEEWMITQMYFLDTYRADKVIEELKTARLF